MKKHPKIAIGIHEDGPSIKLAQIYRDTYQLYLMNLQRIDLSASLYQPGADFTQNGKTSNGDSQNPAGEINLNELDSSFSPGFQINPWDKLFRDMNPERAVLAVNVNEDQIVREAVSSASKHEIKELVRQRLHSRLYKAGEWQCSEVSLGGQQLLWMHLGVNRLITELLLQARQYKKKLYFQLADANDIALTDYFRLYYPHEEQRVLLLYLGNEYRKAFMFSNGELEGIFPLNISEPIPEPELILPRLSLALDSAMVAEPQVTVVCGDLASETLVKYFNDNGPGKTELMTFPTLVPDSTRTDAYDATYLAQFALPITLAFKAIFPDEPRFTPSNFLPKSLREAQKTFKIVWHGFLLAIAVFGVVIYGTFSFLARNDVYHKAYEEKRNLDHQVARLTADTAQLTAMRTEIQSFGENTEAIRGLLVGKNAWGEVLDTLNRLFQTRPISWLVNFKQDNGRLLINGVTTQRDNVIDFAEALPNSRITKVTGVMVHEKRLWSFEISSDLPAVDWVGQIEAEMKELLESQLAQQLPPAEEEIPMEEEVMPPEEAVAEATPAPTPPPAQEQALPKTIQPLTGSAQPQLSSWQSQAGGDAGEDFNQFLEAVRSGNLKQAKTLGENYLYRYEGGRLIPLVRWHLANLLYDKGQYAKAESLLEPLTHIADRHTPYALLLSARIARATGKETYGETYSSLIRDYPGHPASKQAETDLAIINQAGGGQ